MTTWIIHGKPSLISEMQKTLSMISTNLTPPPHTPSPLIQQIFFCSFKSGQNCLLTFTCTTFLSITRKSIFRWGVVLRSYPQGLHLNGLSQFHFSSYLIVSDFEPWGNSLWELTYLTTFTISQTHVCLMAKPCSIKPNFILDSSFLCCAWLCYHTHVYHTCSMLLFHSATAMQLHHVINFCYACPK